MPVLQKTINPLFTVGFPTFYIILLVVIPNICHYIGFIFKNQQLSDFI